MKKCFIDNERDSNRTFLIYGKLNDQFCPVSEPVAFNPMLAKILKSRGYEHVVFYGGAGNKGKYCYDKESARFFFGGGSSANAQKRDSSSSTMTDMMKRASQSSRRRRQPPARGNAASESNNITDEKTENANKNSNNEHEAQQNAQENNNGEQIRYSQIGIANSEFIQEITTFAARGEKFAVVFYNIFDFIESSQDETNRRLLDQIIAMLDQPTSNALCIFEAPSDPDKNMIMTSLNRSPLRVKFLKTEGEHTVLNRNNCIHIGEPCEDEIESLLMYESMQGIEYDGKNVRLKLSYSKMREYSHSIIHESELYTRGDYDPTMYLMIHHIEKWMKKKCDETGENVIEFNENSPIEIFGRAVSQKELEEERKKELEKINIEGWEEVYKFFNQVFSLKRKQVAKYIGKTVIRHDDICIDRLVGVQTSSRTGHNVEIPNFVLTGNPGTGKTEIGRHIANILYEEQLLPTSKLVCVGKSDLTSSLVAGIPHAVMECADRAEGGVLLIDEAPQLADEDGGLNNEGSGPEIVQTLNRIMTDPTRHICVVLTGYKDGMEKLFAIDPGFRSRFGGNEIHIEDYKPKLLRKIFVNKLKNLKGLSFTLSSDIYDGELSDDITQPIDNYMEHLYLKRDRRTFGNARDMTTLARTIAGIAVSHDREVILKEDFYGDAPFTEKNTDGDIDKVDEKWFEPVNSSDSMEQLKKDILEKYVGLEYLVKRFEQIQQRVEESRALGADSDKMRMKSFVLVGVPGSGKDVVANLLGRLLRAINVLNCPDIITKDGNDLASKYVGGSIEEAKSWVKEAQERNALLFINEAHQLCNEHFDGKGALRTFIAPMTNKTQFISAFAVYPDELESFYKLDAGLESRLEVIKLPEYDDVQLFEIFKVMCKKKNRSCTDEVLDIMSKVCVRLYRERQKTSGSARQLETLLGEMDDRRIERCNKENIPVTVTLDDGTKVLNEQRRIFVKDDIPKKYLERLPERGCMDKQVSDFEEIQHKLENEVVGRAGLVEHFRRLSNSALEARAFNKKFRPYPIILVGNPGSGKTMIGRLLSELFNVLGVVRTPVPHTFDASAITSSYVNGVRGRAEEEVKKAREKNALLFVDEAHQLIDQADGKGGMQALISPMNDPENPIVVVFAVYKNRLDEFRKLDDGLSRRVAIIELEDYTGPELKQIFGFMAKKGGVLISDNLDKKLDEVCEYLAQRQKVDVSNGNAGLMERMLDDMNSNRQERCRKAGIPIAKTEEYLTLEVEDIPQKYLP